MKTRVPGVIRKRIGHCGGRRGSWVSSDGMVFAEYKWVTTDGEYVIGHLASVDITTILDVFFWIFEETE